MSNLYRPSAWVRCPKSGRMVRSNPGKKSPINGKAPIKSQLQNFGLK